MADGGAANARWLRIKELFSAALELPPGAHSAWLDAQCGDDRELRAELASLLASHLSDPDFMAVPAIARTGAAHVVAARAGADAQAAMIGRRLGSYRLLSELGRGGMGVVYLAERDDRAFDRRVAIKMTYGGVLHPSLADRFESERRILARFEHQNIARLIDAGTDENGMPFAVIEYVEGTPIDAFVRDRHLAVRQRLELFCAVCDAVQYSHERLIVHRDIKPGNVLVTADGVPKLLDFGIAKLLDPSGGRTEPTRTSLRALTPESASPEQLRGDPVTVATDVYSLGVLLFRLLTDTSPYRPKAATDAEIVRVVCEEDPRRPSDAVADRTDELPRHEIAARRRELSGDLDLITLKALRKEPERRYSSVDHLARDVRRHLAGQPVEAVPDSRRYRAAKFLRRHRAGVAVAAVIAATMVAGVGATLLQARIARMERERAERRFDDVRALASSMIFELHDAIEPLPGSTAARELLVRRALGYLDRLASESAVDLSLQRELASAYARIGEVQGHGGYANLGNKKAALESYRKALGIREKLALAAPSDRDAQQEVARMHRSVGLLLSSIGESGNALEHMRVSVSINERLLQAAPGDASFASELAKSYLSLSDGLVRTEDWAPALSRLRQALPLFQQAAQATPDNAKARRSVALTYKRIGGIEAEVKNYANALEAYRSALAIDRARVASEPDTAEARMDFSLDVSEVGYILHQQGDTRGALVQFEQARAIQEDLVRADPNDVRAKRLLVSVIQRMAAVRWTLGEREAALRARREALPHLERLAAAVPGDVPAQRSLAEELAILGTGYAEIAAGRPSASGCRRARPFLVRAIDAYRGLVAKGGAAAPTSARLSELQATLAGCSGR